MKPWKIQKFFGDLIYDLRNRGLLPIVVLLLVGLVAVPIVISSGGSEPAPPPAPASAEQASDLAPENQKAVLAYNPGVRDYKKRLSALQAKDPFKQQFVQAASAASTLTSTLTGGGSAGTSSGGGGAPSTGSSDTSGSDTSGSSGGTTTTTTTRRVRVRYYSYQTDISVGDANLPLQARKRVSPFTYLPDPAVPVVVFLGPTADGQAAIFLVSQSVSSMSGPGACFPAADACQLMALRQGETQDLIYDVDGKTYRVKVDRIRRVVTSKPPRG